LYGVDEIFRVGRRRRNSLRPLNFFSGARTCSIDVKKMKINKKDIY
jgi:hypothetical protein